MTTAIHYIRFRITKSAHPRAQRGCSLVLMGGKSTDVFLNKERMR